MTAFRIQIAWISLVSSILALVLGCTEKKQTYAEAAQLYDVEMRELTRLEAERDKLVDTAEGGLGDLKDVRDSINSLSGDFGALREATKGLIDPALQDKADKKVEEHHQAIDKQIEQQVKSATKAKEAAEHQLPELERQIEKQKARVETAKKAKEALAP
ncbi:MAG: hypothetical protein IT427_03460 [Pirellulales bacterium]|nr:hypothetical protein [Pirellulales bacterium]